MLPVLGIMDESCKSAYANGPVLQEIALVPYVPRAGAPPSHLSAPLDAGQIEQLRIDKPLKRVHAVCLNCCRLHGDRLALPAKALSTLSAPHSDRLSQCP